MFLTNRRRNFETLQASNDPHPNTMNTQTTSDMPGWARQVDDYGRRRWHKDRSCKKNRGEYIANIVLNLIFLWIVNKIPDWDLGFIANNYGAVLWILNINILVQIGGNLMLALIEIHGVRCLARIIMESANFVTTMALFFIYPFDFSHFHGLYWIDRILPIIFIISMAVSAIKVLANFWKLIFWR